MAKYRVGDEVWYAEKDKLKTTTVEKVLPQGKSESYVLASGNTRFGRDLYPAHLFFIALIGDDSLNILTAYSEAEAQETLAEFAPETLGMSLTEITKWSKDKDTQIRIFEAKPRR